MAARKPEEASSALHLLKGSYEVAKIVVKGGCVFVFCVSAISGAPSAIMVANTLFTGCEAYGTTSVALNALGTLGAQAMYHPKVSFGVLSSAGLFSFCREDFFSMCSHFNQAFWGVGGALSGLILGRDSKVVDDSNITVIFVEDMPGEEELVSLLGDSNNLEGAVPAPDAMTNQAAERAINRAPLENTDHAEGEMSDNDDDHHSSDGEELEDLNGWVCVSFISPQGANDDDNDTDVLDDA